MALHPSQTLERVLSSTNLIENFVSVEPRYVFIANHANRAEVPRLQPHICRATTDTTEQPFPIRVIVYKHRHTLLARVKFKANTILNRTPAREPHR